ncbi:MAG: heavy-metal-associated domain-containing protein [Candidatus Sericytochromatia bacterium]|nr:heavy-metal-associated domain-containing protein [Candidatus Tanganyikabacteria bacterium]
MQTNVTMHEARLAVEELTCKTCVRKVVEALQAVDGVVAVHVLDSPERIDGPADRTLRSDVVIKFVDGRVREQDLARAVRAAGYRVLA